MVLYLVIWQAMWCTVMLFRSILQGIVRLRMWEQCWQSVVESHLAGKLFHQGIEIQHTAATYPSGSGLQDTSMWFSRLTRMNLCCCQQYHTADASEPRLSIICRVVCCGSDFDSENEPHVVVKTLTCGYAMKSSILTLRLLNWFIRLSHRVMNQHF